MSMALFDMAPHPRYRRSDPQTSVDAARTVSGRTERLILAVFRSNRYQVGYTDDELCGQFLGACDGTIKTARSRLSNRGLLVDSGIRRPSQRGRDQIVWALKEPVG